MKGLSYLLDWAEVCMNLVLSSSGHHCSSLQQEEVIWTSRYFSARPLTDTSCDVSQESETVGDAGGVCWFSCSQLVINSQSDESADEHTSSTQYCNLNLNIKNAQKQDFFQLVTCVIHCYLKQVRVCKVWFLRIHLEFLDVDAGTWLVASSLQFYLNLQ